MDTYVPHVWHVTGGGRKYVWSMTLKMVTYVPWRCVVDSMSVAPFVVDFEDCHHHTWIITYFRRWTFFDIEYDSEDGLSCTTTPWCWRYVGYTCCGRLWRMSPAYLSSDTFQAATFFWYWVWLWRWLAMYHDAALLALCRLHISG
jgi:hypothetical protein